jgi:hypothetical protein
LFSYIKPCWIWWLSIISVTWLANVQSRPIVSEHIPCTVHDPSTSMADFKFTSATRSGDTMGFMLSRGSGWIRHSMVWLCASVFKVPSIYWWVVWLVASVTALHWSWDITARNWMSIPRFGYAGSVILSLPVTRFGGGRVNSVAFLHCYSIEESVLGAESFESWKVCRNMQALSFVFVRDMKDKWLNLNVTDEPCFPELFWDTRKSSKFLYHSCGCHSSFLWLLIPFDNCHLLHEEMVFPRGRSLRAMYDVMS